MYRLKDWQGLFMSYDKWFKFNNFDPKYYDEVYFLYSDRWMVTLLPLSVLIFVIVFGYFFIKDMVGML